MLASRVHFAALMLMIPACWSFPSRAADVDGVSYLNAALAKKPDVSVDATRTVTELECVGEPGGVRYMRLCTHHDTVEHYKTNVHPSVSNSRLVDVKNLVFDKTRMVSLPDAGLLSRKTIKNCGDATLTSSLALALSGTSSWSVSKTSGLSTTIGGSVNMQVSYAGVGGGGMNINWSQTVSSSETKSEGESHTVSRSTNDSVTVQEHKAILFELFAYQTTIEVPYSANLVIDGDAVSNLSSFSKASQLLTEAERTVPFTGVLRISDVSDAIVRTENLGAPQDCKGNEGKFLVSEVPTETITAQTFGAYGKSGFSTQKSIPRTAGVVQSQARPFSTMSLTADDGGPTIGAPDGTSYEVLYTTMIYKPTPACGFNDAGVMIAGIFLREARQYRTYVGGSVVAQWQDFSDTFQACQQV